MALNHPGKPHSEVSEVAKIGCKEMELATLGSTFGLLYLIQKEMVCLKSKSNIQTDNNESTYDAVLFCTHLLEIETAFKSEVS